MIKSIKTAILCKIEGKKKKNKNKWKLVYNFKNKNLKKKLILPLEYYWYFVENLDNFVGYIYFLFLMK